MRMTYRGMTRNGYRGIQPRDAACTAYAYLTGGATRQHTWLRVHNYGNCGERGYATFSRYCPPGRVKRVADD